MAKAGGRDGGSSGLEAEVLEVIWVKIGEKVEWGRFLLGFWRRIGKDIEELLCPGQRYVEQTFFFGIRIGFAVVKNLLNGVFSRWFGELASVDFEENDYVGLETFTTVHGASGNVLDWIGMRKRLADELYETFEPPTVERELVVAAEDFNRRMLVA